MSKPSRLLESGLPVTVGNVTIVSRQREKPTSTKVPMSPRTLPPLQNGTPRLGAAAGASSAGAALPSGKPPMHQQQPQAPLIPQSPRLVSRASSISTPGQSSSSSNQSPSTTAREGRLIIGPSPGMSFTSSDTRRSPSPTSTALKPKKDKSKPDWCFNIWSMRESIDNPWCEAVEPKMKKRNMQQELVALCRWGSSAAQVTSSTSASSNSSNSVLGGGGGLVSSTIGRVCSYDLLTVFQELGLDVDALPLVPTTITTKIPNFATTPSSSSSVVTGGSTTSAPPTSIITVTVPSKDLCEEALSYIQQSTRMIKPSDIVELASMTKPPPLVEKIFGYVCVLLRIKPEWGYAKRTILKDASLLSYWLRNVNVCALSRRRLRKATNYACKHLQGLDASLVAPLCRASVPLAHWVQSIISWW